MFESGASTLMPPKKRAGGRPKTPDPKRSIASFRGTTGFADWFEWLVTHRRLPASVLIEHALIEYAERHGYKPKAPER
jgi:hypothetical protein